VITACDLAREGLGGQAAIHCPIPDSAPANPPAPMSSPSFITTGESTRSRPYPGRAAIGMQPCQPLVAQRFAVTSQTW
jgi:hypothetical protein